MRSIFAIYLIVSIFTVSLSSVNHSVHSLFCDLEVAEETGHESHGCGSNQEGACSSGFPEQGEPKSTECSPTTCPVIAFSSAAIYLDSAQVATRMWVSFVRTSFNSQCLATEKLGKYNLVRGPPQGSMV